MAKTTASSEMPDTDLGNILATFLKSQEKRDALLRDEITKVDTVATKAKEDASESLTILREMQGKIETAFSLLNEGAKSRQTSWPTMFAGAVVLGSMVAFILLPIRSDISDNRESFTTMNNEVTQLRIGKAVAHERQNQLAERSDWNRRMSNSWVDEKGNTAFPASEYIPFESDY